MAFIHLPTTFAIYVVLDKESGVVKLVKECKTRGEALEWIYKSGEPAFTYCIQEHFKKKQ